MGLQQAAVGPASGRILLVDDNGALRRVFTRVFHQAGYLVTEVSNGREAMAAAGVEDFDVVVSDVRMPDMGGVELLEAMHERDSDLPVLLMSGDPDLETAMKAVKFGAFEYLTKPVALSVLSGSVARALELRRSRLVARQALEEKSGERRSP
jgi:DNA-binding NtrC family response regulator